MSDFSKSFDDVMEADKIRSSIVTGASRQIYKVEGPWTMIEEPWRVQWYDNRIDKVCQVYVVGDPFYDEKYVTFMVYMDGEIKNYVFLIDQYHYLDEETEGEEDETIID